MLAAVADADPEKRAAAEAQFGCRSCDIDGLLGDDGIDGVVVALPPVLHPDVALKVIAAGKHLLVEKPMAMTVTDGEKIVAAAEAAGVVAMTGHILRFHAGYTALEEAVRAGDLGPIRYVHSTRLALGKFFPGTDVMWDIAPHELSLLLAMVGEAPNSGRMDATAGISDGADYVHLHYGFPSGARSHTFVSRLSPQVERRFSVIGEAAMAVYDDAAAPGEKLAIFRHRVARDGGGVAFERAQPEYRAFTDRPPLTAELEEFLGAIREGRQPRSSVREGLDVIRALELCATATENG